MNISPSTPVGMPLPNGSVAWFDAEDVPTVIAHRWHRHVTRSGVYVRSYDGGKYTYLHRLLLNAPPGHAVDHRDGDTFNNRRSNLRLCTTAQNNANTSGWENRQSRYKGVSRNRARWVAGISYGGKRHYIGSFNTEREAAQAYDTHACRVFGEFARLNFTEEPCT